MRYTKPYYFDHFKCAASQCPDTCCAGWQIMIDEAALEKYKQVKNALGSRLVNGIDWLEGSFQQYVGRCSMLNDNNLCDLVTELGEEWLCETCHRYPRHVEEYEGLREWSLSLSCPIAAHLILECKEPLRFIVEENDEEDPLEEEFEDFDFLLFTQLEDARNVLFQIVQDRTKPIEKRVKGLLQMASKMQKCLDQDRLYDVDDIIASYAEELSLTGDIRKENAVQENAIDEEKRFRMLQEHFNVFLKLERLREEWGDVLMDAEQTLFCDYASYRQIRQEFLSQFGEKGAWYKRWEQFQENILLFFLYTYFCGAVYDDWIYSKVALAAFSALFIGEFVMCKWYLADKHVSWTECVELAYRYAREVEHSDDNLNLLEEWLKGTED